jgi:hypothetical protein
MQQPNYPGHGSSHSPSPRPAKADLQRAYRTKEVESFNLLRDVIKDITGEEIQTRNEILRKGVFAPRVRLGYTADGLVPKL